MNKKFFFSYSILFFLFSACFSQNIITLDYLNSFGERGDGLGQFHQAQGIAIDLNGNIYIADSGNHRIQKFDSKGSFQVYLGGIGTGSEQFDNPTDICSPDGLNVYVADFNNHRIHLLDRKLNSVSIFTGDSPIESEFKFSFPKSLIVSKQGDYFFIETEENSILKFNSFYNPIARFGAIETGEGVLNDPIKIELINNEFVCVTDAQTARIVIFDYFGNFIKYIGEDLLTNPSAIFYWSEKNLLLATDLGQQKIYAFDLNGKHYLLQPIQTSSENKWQTPVDLAVFQNKLFVLDQDKNLILIYQIVDIPELN